MTLAYPVTNGIITFIEPPEGYNVDFQHPKQQKAIEHYLIFGIMGSIAFIALSQRLYTKICLSTGVKIDDGTCLNISISTFPFLLGRALC